MAFNGPFITATEVVNAIQVLHVTVSQGGFLAVLKPWVWIILMKRSRACRSSYWH